MKSIMFALLAMVASGCCGAVSVTASRDYVDKKTTLHPVEESGTTNVVGYFLGTQTNKVLISEYGIGKSTPGDYYNVSNAAMRARSKTDMNVYTNSADAEGMPIATGGTLATTGDIAEAMSTIQTDRITDGTNTIDAARNVYLRSQGWSINASANGIASSATSEEIVAKTEIGMPIWSNGRAYIYDDILVTGWFVKMNQSEGAIETGEEVYIDYEYLGSQGGEQSRLITLNRDYDWTGDGDLVTLHIIWEYGRMNLIGKLAMTNDIPKPIDVVAPSMNVSSGQAADAKATGDAIYSGFTPWVCSVNDIVIKRYGSGWAPFPADDPEASSVGNAIGDANSTRLEWSYETAIEPMTAARHYFPPTKTSQIDNDGPPEGNGAPYITAKDVNYAMAMPGEWKFSGSGYDPTKTYIVDEYEQSPDPLVLQYGLFENGNMIDQVEANTRLATVSFPIPNITATRPSLPGHLLDRAINLISVTDAETLYLPSTITNKSRDFVVNMVLANGAQSISFTNSSDEVITWAKDAPPATFDEGTNIIRFTEVTQSCFLYQKLPAEGGGGSVDMGEVTNAAIAVADAKISTNNSAFVSAVLSVPLAGADAGDLAELSEYGSYGTVGAAILALIAGLAALKRRMTAAETAISGKANVSDLPYAMVTISTPTVWLFSGSGVQSGHVYSVVETELEGYWTYSLKDNDSQISYFEAGEQLTTLDFSDAGTPQIDIVATLVGYQLLDRTNNLIDATTGDVTLTLPAYQEGNVRDMLVACTIGLDGNDEPWRVIFQGQGSEAPSGADEISFKAEGDDAASATFPVPTAAGDWWYSLTERAPHVFAVSLKQLQSVSQPTQTQGGS